MKPHNSRTKCESFVVNVTGSCGSPDGQLYATLPTTWINFEPVRAKSIRFNRSVSAENSTYIEIKYCNAYVKHIECSDGVRICTKRVSMFETVVLYTLRKQPTKLLCTLAPRSALGFTEPPTYTRDDESMVNFPAICEWSVYTSSTTATSFSNYKIKITFQWKRNTPTTTITAKTKVEKR